MLAPFLLAVFPTPLSLDGISVEHAHAFHGRLVAATFLSAKPLNTLLGRAVIGAAAGSTSTPAGGSPPPGSCGRSTTRRRW